MSDKVIIELELLTPMKYEKFISTDEPFSEIMYEVTKVHKEKNTVRNTRHLGKPDYDDIDRAERVISIASINIRSLLDEKAYTYDMVEFKGLCDLEENNYCALLYIVTNSHHSKVRSFLKTFVSGRIDSTAGSYVIRTDLDDKTIGTFKDMFEEL